LIKPAVLVASLLSVVCAHAAQAQIALTLSPEQVPELTGVTIGRMSVVRCHRGVLEPVPFQIDELDEQGFVWFEGSGFKRKGAAGVFDSHDQLLVMSEDGGTRCTNKQLARIALVASEIEVRSPDDSRRYFYVVLDRNERSSTRYIEHDPVKGVTRTPYYFLTTDPENELNWRYLGYSGYQGPADASIIDTLKMRMSGGVFMRFARMTLDNDNLRPKRTGFRIGPIRSVMHLETNVVFAGLPVMKLHVQALRYPNHYEAHSYAKVPLLYRKTLKQPQVTVSVDGNNLVGAQVWTAGGGELRALVDGHIDAQEEQLRNAALSTENSWIMFDSGRGFALLTELLVPPELEGIPLSLVYDDDRDAENGPEHYRGQMPNLGYALNGWPPTDELNFSVRLLFFSSLDNRPVKDVAALRSGKALTITSRAVPQ